MADIQLLAYVGIFLGVVARTAIPYLIKKLKAGTSPFAFDWKYGASAIVALIAAASTAQTLLADFALPATATNASLAFWAGLAYAGIWNTLLNAVALDYKAPS